MKEKTVNLLIPSKSRRQILESTELMNGEPRTLKDGYVTEQKLNKLKCRSLEPV